MDSSIANVSTFSEGIQAETNDSNGYVQITVIKMSKPPSQPELFTTQPNAGSVNLSGDIVTLQWSESTDPDGDAITYTLEFYDGSTWTTIASEISDLTYSHTLPSLNTSSVQYRVKAVDSNGTGSPYTSSDLFIIKKYLLLISDGGKIKTYKDGVWKTI
ncbi:fibronectin type III domain-containing protein [Campylobacter jejuni]|nr:fibronectin type III domain-containing protein [Campylobacter jejuni]